MAFNVGQGLVAAAESISKTAGAYTLESQRAGLQKELAVLANQMATERESVGRQEKGLIDSAHQEKEHAFRGTLEREKSAADLERTKITAGTSLSVAQIGRQTQIDLQRMKDSADPDEVRTAIALEKLTPEQWGALERYQQSKHDPAKRGAGPFTGSGTEAQALNMLIANGTLSQQQAAELAAGKTITNPADGSVIFMTPTGIFRRPTQGPSVPMPGASDAPQAGPLATQPPQSGMIPITQPKAGANLSPGERKVDERFATEYADFVASGGYADVDKQLKQLKEVAKQLETRKDLTGPIIGSIPEGIRRVTHPDAVATRETVEEVVQRNLRVILGPQFTEKEGERLIARGYNPSLGEEENAKRVERLITQIQAAAQAKADASRYYEENGTLKGWKGKLPSLSDFDVDTPGSQGGDKERTGTPRVRDQKEYDALSPGAVYTAPDGTVRTKR